MGNRLMLDLHALTVNPDLDRVYYAQVPFYLASYLVGLLDEAGCPRELWRERLMDDLEAFNASQLDGAVYPSVISATVNSCIENHVAGRRWLFKMVREGGLSVITKDLGGYTRRKPKRTAKRAPKGASAASRYKKGG